MKILLENIKELIQVEEEPVLFRAGKEMSKLNKIKNAFLIIRDEVIEEYGVDLVDSINRKYDAIVLAVSHKEFFDLDIKGLTKDSSSVIFDTKAFLNRDLVDSRL